MGCPSRCVLEKNIVFSICCHATDTGILTDADAAPSYRVYEDETGAAILTGTMTKLDDANTTGFYTELIACTATNGFENDKTYTIYIQATVDAKTGGIAYGFTTKTDDLDQIFEGTLTKGQFFQAVMAFVANKVTGGGTTTITSRDHADSKDRVTMTVDANGNRSSVIYDFD